MRYRNNGQGEDNILQNQFTTYLVTAIRWQKIAYLKKRTKLGTHELPTDFDSAFAQMLETQGTSAASVEQLVLDSLMLSQALGQISDRERYIFLHAHWRSAALTILPKNSAWGIRESPQPITGQSRN